MLHLNVLSVSHLIVHRVHAERVIMHTKRAIILPCIYFSNPYPTKQKDISNTFNREFFCCSKHKQVVEIDGREETLLRKEEKRFVLLLFLIPSISSCSIL